MEDRIQNSEIGTLAHASDPDGAIASSMSSFGGNAPSEQASDVFKARTSSKIMKSVLTFDGACRFSPNAFDHAFFESIAFYG